MLSRKQTELGIDLSEVEEHEKSLSILSLPDEKRESYIIRNTPVVNSKYLPVWKRVRAKLQMQKVFGGMKNDLLIYGTEAVLNTGLVVDESMKELINRRTENVLRLNSDAKD